MTPLVRWISFFFVLLLVMSTAGCFPANEGSLEDEKEYHYLAGKSRVGAMDYRGGIEEYEKALEVNPRNASAHFELAWLYDQKEPDPAAAIYHYERFLRLQPTSGKAEAARTRVLACKQELAKGILPTATPGVQHDLDMLAAENARLRDELDRWRANAIRMQMPTNPGAITAQTPVGNHDAHTEQPSGGGTIAVSSHGLRPAPQNLSGATASMRTHTVQPGESPYSISRKYGVKLEALMDANPGLDPRRMRIGQTLNIPSS